MAQARYIFDATADNFRNLVLENSERGPVLVNYWSPKAGPCMLLMPRLIELAKAYQGRFLLVMLNTDEFGRLARDHGVTSIPTIKVFRRGKAVDTLHGAESEKRLRALIDKHVASGLRSPHLAALQAFQKGKVEDAVSLAAQAALDHPEDFRIPLDLAKLLVLQGRQHQAHDLLNALPAPAKQNPEIGALLAHLGFILAAQTAPPAETLGAQIAANPGDLEARYRLAAVKLVQNEYTSAMEQLIEIARRDRKFRDDIGRKGLLAIFNILGDEHKLVRYYRGLLQNVVH
ncbi:MAG: hypothetical protein A2150_07940 [Candidatus Muproteobacteria bacterium RBG_16_64_11]|uniref:Thioredoxin domain-containing protein n=1 Tax=Candidatus Muproteobacteria bacterium RBG_16_64_11 TaxID=1817758 RepID=A0A1F6TEI1_9PROT|nr:MAG: hypothetical protein A2150_07940 [Candidatus Muproteobacteria bacterium RBG_16_64_11]